MNKPHISSISIYQNNKVLLELTDYPSVVSSRIDGLLFLDMTLLKHNRLLKSP